MTLLFDLPYYILTNHTFTSEPDQMSNTAPVPSPSISIIGAGFAGLMSGRCLKTMGIPSRIFEKRIPAYKTSRIITLRPWAYEPFSKVLEIDCHQLAEKDINPDIDTSDSMYCPQDHVEDLLSRKLNVGYWQESSKTERLYSQIRWLLFNLVPSPRETVNRCQLIIGADGVHSSVRHLVLPEIELRILPYVVYYGSRRMTAERYKDNIAPHKKYPAMFQFRKETQTLLRIIPCPPNSLLDHEYVYVKYTYSRPAHEKDPVFRPDRRAREADTIPNEFYREIESLKDLGPGFGEIFHPQHVRQDKILNWLMRSLLVPLEKLQELADQGILLIGDAAHAMPILGSEGANWAIKDGNDLANHLADNQFSQLRSFYEQRYPEWQRAVSESERRLSDMHNYDYYMSQVIDQLDGSEEEDACV